MSAEPLERALTALERDRDRHLTAGPSSDAELRALEQQLGQPLPAGLRAFLARLGGGLFYEQHEIFGPRRLMIHDIELVPDALSVRRRLEARDQLPGPSLLPFHRSGDRMHLVDLRAGAGEPRVVAADGSESFSDLAAFLDAVVLTPPARGA